MAEELPKLINGDSDSFKKIPFREYIAHSKINPKTEEKPVQGFFRRIGEIFKGSVEPKEEHPLSGRISELHSSATDSLVALLNFKENIKKDVDPQLYAFICSIIDPIIKEVTRIQESIDRDTNTAQKVKSFNRYVDWIEKAHEWVEIGQQHAEKETINQAVINQTVKDFQAKIDRDIRLVQDYLGHAMDGFDLPEPLKNELKEKLMPELLPSLIELQALRQPSGELTLDEFIAWRSFADEARENLHDRALHIIDTFSKEFLPSPSREIETGLALEGMTRLNFVESQISEISLELEGDPPIEEFQRKNYLERMNKLTDVIHEFNGNLLLSHEQHDRLQQSIDILASLRDRLS